AATGSSSMITTVPALGPSLAVEVCGTPAAGPSSGGAAAITSGCGSGSGSGVAFQGRHESDSVDGATGTGVVVSSSHGWPAVTGSGSAWGSAGGPKANGSDSVSADLSSSAGVASTGWALALS